jgi:hypothetical protein
MDDPAFPLQSAPELPSEHPPDDHRRVAQVQERSVRDGEWQPRVVLQSGTPRDGTPASRRNATAAVT